MISLRHMCLPPDCLKDGLLWTDEESRALADVRVVPALTPAEEKAIRDRLYANGLRNDTLRRVVRVTIQRALAAKVRETESQN